MPDYMSKGGRTYRIITDFRGSVRLVVDTETGNVAQRIDYDAFGQIMLNTAPGFQPFGFAGGLYDEQTGLTRLGARDYDAYTGRWTAKDPSLFDGGNPNLYAYASNDPINAVDVTGETSLIELVVTRWVEDNLPAVIKDGWAKAEEVMKAVRKFESSQTVKDGRVAEDLVNRAIDGFVESPEDDGVEAIAAAMELWQGQVANVAREGMRAALESAKEMFYVPKFVLNYERVNCQGVESSPFLYAESGWYNPRRGPLPPVWGDIVAACHAFGK